MSARHPPTIPIVDLLGDAEAASETIDRALRRYGFFHLRDHGLDELYESYAEELRRFFSLDHEEKMRFCLNKGYGSGGYVPRGVEAVGRSSGGGDDARADPVENLSDSDPNLRTYPSAERGYRYGDALVERAGALRAALDGVLIQVMRLSARALNLADDNFFESSRGGYGGREPGRRESCYLRSARYFDDDNHLATGNDDILLYGAHTDYTGFTFLWRSRDNGLQCLLEEGGGAEWIDVPPLGRNVLTVNAGDLIQRWTNGRWRSNIHRVLKKRVTKSRGERAAAGGDSADGPAVVQGNPNDPSMMLSIVYFTGPANDTVCDPKDLRDLGGDVSGCVYEPVVAGEWLQMKLARSNI